MKLTDIDTIINYEYARGRNDITGVYSIMNNENILYISDIDYHDINNNFYAIDITKTYITVWYIRDKKELHEILLNRESHFIYYHKVIIISKDMYSILI